MAITRWRNPALELDRMQHRMQQVFDDVFRTRFLTEEMPWIPSVQMTETDGSIEITAELPGVGKEDVGVDLENNVLTIHGEKKEEKEEKEKERYLYERYYGSFQRSFALPTPVDENKVVANFKNGVLKVHLEKTAEAKGKKIPIAVD
jgi:HSP20 family protein